MNVTSPELSPLPDPEGVRFSRGLVLTSLQATASAAMNSVGGTNAATLRPLRTNVIPVSSSERRAIYSAGDR
jgi:hypothetical protein